MRKLQNVLLSYLFVSEIAAMETVLQLQLGESSN